MFFLCYVQRYEMRCWCLLGYALTDGINSARKAATRTASCSHIYIYRPLMKQSALLPEKINVRWAISTVTKMKNGAPLCTIHREVRDSATWITRIAHIAQNCGVACLTLPFVGTIRFRVSLCKVQVYEEVGGKKKSCGTAAWPSSNPPVTWTTVRTYESNS